MQKEVNLLPIIGVVLLVILLIVAALTLTQCGSEVSQPTEPSGATDPTEEETQPTETEEPTEPPHVHAWEETVTEPDCISSGYTTYVCACGESYVDGETEALGHTWADATCTAPKTCTACGASEGREKGHVWDEGKVTREETETEDGEMLFTCTVCQTTKTQVIPSPGHTHDYEENVVVTPPICTEAGFTTHTCRCGDSRVDSEVPALGHSWKDATCTAPEVCTVCGTTGDPAPGHIWLDATCTTPKTCDRCKDTIGSALGHKWQNIAGYPATCTEDGLTDGIQCARCEAWDKEQVTIPAPGHTETIVEGKDPTCTETGLTDGIQCSVCDLWIKEQEVTPLIDHTPETVEGYPPTCTGEGLTDGKKCAECDKELEAQKPIEPTGHTEKTVKGYPATCTQTGLTDGIQCSVCKEWIKAREELPIVPHTETTVKGTPATCTATGKTDGKKCSVCGEVLVKQETIPALGHKEVIVEGKEPTLTETGLTEGKKCSTCGKVTVAQQTIPVIKSTAVVQYYRSKTMGKGASYDEWVYPELDRDLLKANGVVELHVTITFKATGTNALNNNCPNLTVYSYTGEKIDDFKWGDIDGSDTEKTLYTELTMSINCVNADGSFKLTWWTDDYPFTWPNDGWVLKDTTIQIESIT